MARTSDTHPIRIDFIKSDSHPILNQIGITLAPGKKQMNPFSGEDWNRDVLTDLTRMKEVFGMQKLVSMIEAFEYRELGIEDLPKHCAELGIDHHVHSIVDGSIPSDPNDFAKDITVLADELKRGRRMVVHCKGGLGRAALTAACLIVCASDGEVSAEDAIRLVQDARGHSAIADRRQQRFVKNFAEQFLIRKQEIDFARPQMKTDDKELVFLVGNGHERVGIVRFPVSDGRWFFFYKVVTSVAGEGFDEYGFGYEEALSDPFSSFEATLNAVFPDGAVFAFAAEFIHEEYFDRVRMILEQKIRDLDSDEVAFFSGQLPEPITFESWLESSLEESEGNVEDEELEDEHDWPNGMERTERNFLLYWQIHSIVNSAGNHQPLDLISSRQLARVSPGDRIWIVTIDGNGRLLLAGQMKVGEIVDRETAIETIGSSNVWDGELFALPDDSENTHYIHTVDAHHIAPMLRFGADGASAFNLSDGRLSPNDLQMMREVSFETSSHLYDLWATSYPFPEDAEDLDDEFEDDDDSDSGEGIDADMEMFMEMQRMEAEKMIAEARDTLRDNPNDEMAMYNMGVAYGMMGEHEKERDCYNKVLLSDPDNISARFNLGCSYANDGNVDAAIAEFRILVDAGVDFARPYFMLGTLLAHQGRVEEGIRMLRRGLPFDPEDGQAYFNIGRAFMSIGRFSEAIVEFEKAKSVGFDDIEICLLLGMCYRETGEKQKELDSYLSGLEINMMAMDLIFNAGTAWAHIHGGEEGRSIPYKEFNGEFMLDDPTATFHLALGMIATGVIDEARNFVNDLGGSTTELGSKLTRMIRIAESL
jgi:tetratricopeptide (TPR) repeat protein/protein-tyrosine phosphatase